MTTSTRLLTALMSLVTALGLAAFVAPGTAAAADTAYNQKSQRLTANPNASMPESCVERRIFLAAGRYDWGQRMDENHEVTRPGMQLGEGWYLWRDCLWPENGYYIQTSILDPETPGWANAGTGGDWDLSSDREYLWGGFLDPLFP